MSPTCAHCGAALAENARGCRECGADLRLQGRWDHVLPEEDAPQRHRPWVRFVAVALVLLSALGLIAVGGWLFVGLALVVVGLTVVVAWSRRSKGAQERAAWHRLRVITRGDDAAARRLVAAERSRRPQATELQAIHAAIARLENDRR